MDKKIYPYLIGEQQMIGYYEILLDRKYKVVIFDKDEDNEIYNKFLPHIKNMMFWTFNLSESNIKGVDKKEFNKMPNDIKAAVCGRDYYTTVFKKGDNLIICFKSGICFAITNDPKEAKKVKNYEAEIQMQAINLRDEDTYEIPKQAKERQSYLYLYILELYKMIFMNKIRKDMQTQNKFDKARNDFVNFIEHIYNTKITDDKEYITQIEKWDNEFDLEKMHINIDSEFDLIYKNNKLNDNKKIKKWCAILLTILLIIGVISIWRMMQ